MPELTARTETLDSLQIDTEETIAQQIFSMDNELEDNFRLGEEDCAQLGRDILATVLTNLTVEEFAALKAAQTQTAPT